MCAFAKYTCTFVKFVRVCQNGDFWWPCLLNFCYFWPFAFAKVLLLFLAPFQYHVFCPPALSAGVIFGRLYKMGPPRNTVVFSVSSSSSLFAMLERSVKTARTQSVKLREPCIKGGKIFGVAPFVDLLSFLVLPFLWDNPYFILHTTFANVTK